MFLISRKKVSMDISNINNESKKNVNGLYCKINGMVNNINEIVLENKEITVLKTV